MNHPGFWQNPQKPAMPLHPWGEMMSFCVVGLAHHTKTHLKKGGAF